MQQYNHFEYGEKLARRLNPIAHTDDDRHYYRATEAEELEELSERINGAHGMILIAIDGGNSDFGYRNSDSLMEQPQYFFVVAKQAPSSNTENIFSAITESKAVALQIIARMMQDGYNNDAKNPLQFLDSESITLRSFGPIGHNFYGMMLGFNLNRGINYTIDKSMWRE